MRTLKPTSCVFVLQSDNTYQSIKVYCNAVFWIFYNFIKDFTILNVECFYYWIITVPVLCVCVCIHTHTHTHTHTHIYTYIHTLLLHLQHISIPCIIQPFFILHILLYFTGKLDLKIFRKVRRKELNVCNVVDNIEEFQTTSDIRNICKRYRYNLHVLNTNLSKYQEGIYNTEIKPFNNFSPTIKSLNHNIKKLYNYFFCNSVVDCLNYVMYICIRKEYCICAETCSTSLA
jgi:hypothetical protein